MAQVRQLSERDGDTWYEAECVTCRYFCTSENRFQALALIEAHESEHSSQ